MAFSDLCKISNAYKAVENEPDQSERIMEENSMVRDLITKILDEGTGPTEPLSSPEKPLSTGLSNTPQYPKTSSSNFIPPSSSYNTYQDSYTFPQSEQNGYNFNIQTGFGTNGFVNYENDVSTLLGIEPMAEPTSEVSPEQLNLLRLAAQEIGGAQFNNPTPKFDNYNFFEPSQRNSLPETNMFAANNFNRPNSLNLDSLNYNANLLDSNPYTNNAQRFPNKFSEAFLKEGQNTQDSDLLGYLNQLNMSDRPREENMMQNNMADFKMPMEMNGHFNEEHFNKMAAEERSKMFFNRNFNQPPQKNFNGENNYYINEMMKNMGSPDKNYQIAQNFDFNNQSGQMPNNFKPNGFQQPNEFMQRRDVNQMMPREGFQANGPMNEQRGNFGANDNMQQAAMMRQNQELARQMSLLMRNRPPPNQLNVDVSFLHENAPFNMGKSRRLIRSKSARPAARAALTHARLPLLAPFYAMRNMRTAQTSSAILHHHLDTCYEQWRQLERERKRTEARLALSYPGRAVSSCNSIPVPRLPPCPTRVDRLTVDMLREHTKVLTLMGKMETLRASVCVAQNKKSEVKLTVLKRGQDDVPSDKEDTNNMHIAPHSEIESAMLAWRSAVAGVQAARRRELQASHRYNNSDPILQLADAVKQLAQCARRARCAMWCDLTVTVALAPHSNVSTPANDKPQATTQASPQKTQEASSQPAAKQTNSDTKEEKPQTDSSTKPDAKTEANNKTANKQPEKTEQKPQQRRTQNYRHKVNQQQGRIDFYGKNQSYGGTRFMHNRHPYHYLATGPIN
ncbi:unnamed protein product [Plutella xylostella]|uniref:(diamondback moth) hypothetical protein n=1 Tax=Plutella xylostella TaxID=51655 RepID=A0A8S4F1W0_PLUXY|nr:unnamed protein product [Plutella xylostella]